MAGKDSSETEGRKSRPCVSVPITVEEEKLLKELVSRYQNAVIERNRKTGQTLSANVHDCEIMRAGLAALNAVAPEKLRSLVSNLDRKKKGRPRSND